jgi:hypothetical protein
MFVDGNYVFKHSSATLVDADTDGLAEKKGF